MFMRIACVDKTAADRLKLQQRLEEAYLAARSSVGHLPVATIQPISKEELLLGAPPTVVVTGCGYSIEELAAVLRDLRQAHPSLRFIVLLDRTLYSLRTLRRIESYTRDIFPVDEEPTRLLHTLVQLQERQAQRPQGKLVVVDGVKGGVGATSIVGGLVHAAETFGITTVVADLSAAGALVHYMGSTRWQSADIATTLVDRLEPDEGLIERSVVVAPNGVHLFLPPGGGAEVRELWLRDPTRLETSLRCIDLLLERFDLVVVDTAGAEGVFPFALRARAHVRLLVTSNEPASVHLLSRRLSEITLGPGEGHVHVLVNTIVERGLSKDDVIDFLLMSKHFREDMARLLPIPFDAHGRNWIGTGNTFYTESRRLTQARLERCLAVLLALPESPTTFDSEAPSRLKSIAKRISAGAVRIRDRAPRAALPSPDELPFQMTGGERMSRPVTRSIDSRDQLPIDAAVPDITLYEAPKLVPQSTGERGALSLEQALFIGATVITAAVSLPLFFRLMSGYLSGFHE